MKGDRESGYLNILWQGYVQKTRPGFKTSRHLLLRTVAWDNYENGDHDFRVLHFLFVDKNLKGDVERSFLPLYRYTSSRKGDFSFSFLFNLYHFSKQRLPDSDEFYQEEKILWFLRLRSNYHRLKEEGKLEGIVR